MGHVNATVAVPLKSLPFKALLQPDALLVRPVT